MHINRRTVISRMSVLLCGIFASNHGSAASRTPETTEGPFYPTPRMRFSDVDNDLVKVAGLVTEAGGEVVHLRGVVVDKNGKPQAGLRVEIWQCDMNGKYLHTGDRQKVTYDKGFQGFGHDITDSDGVYRFRTIKPTKYPGRTPHVHVKVLRADQELLTSQFYLKDHPDNRFDGIYRRMSTEQAASVSMEFVEGEGALEANVNIVV